MLQELEQKTLAFEPTTVCVVSLCLAELVLQSAGEMQKSALDSYKSTATGASDITTRDLL